MSSISHLQIRGIRSFGPDEPQTITFAKPLTVITGQNGCGKTTIIECLKFATTGGLPPGGGQSFVHDPKMSHTAEIKGQIRLKFTNKANQVMICQRDIQVSQAKSKLTYKALDAQLTMHHVVSEGKKEILTISKTTTAMDALMHELLGVPKAVLEHVVFCECCSGRAALPKRTPPPPFLLGSLSPPSPPPPPPSHSFTSGHQEESNWPLMEGAKLKERFDQIFESVRFAKESEFQNTIRTTNHFQTLQRKSFRLYGQQFMKGRNTHDNITSTMANLTLEKHSTQSSTSLCSSCYFTVLL